MGKRRKKVGTMLSELGVSASQELVFTIPDDNAVGQRSFHTSKDFVHGILVGSVYFTLLQLAFGFTAEDLVLHTSVFSSVNRTRRKRSA